MQKRLRTTIRIASPEPSGQSLGISRREVAPAPGSLRGWACGPIRRNFPCQCCVGIGPAHWQSVGLPRGRNDRALDTRKEA